jgi:signal transduction histidine kinase
MPGAGRILRGVYIARLAVAIAVFIAAVTVWTSAERSATLIVTLALVSALLFTVASLAWTEVLKRPASPTFYYLQVLFDLALVTAAVHVTWDESRSEFAPLYILVIAVSALLVPPVGVPLVAALAIVLYFADAMLGHGTAPDAALFFQLAVFTVVALTSGVIAARLRAVSAPNEARDAELAAFRLREEEYRTLTIRAERLEGIAEMSASLAHEIRNPLASIRSAVEQLARIPRAGEDERVLGELVQRESDRLSRLLTEFLDFARTGVTRVSEIDVAAIARNAARLAGGRSDLPPGVRVVESLPSSPLVIEGDEDLIHRAIFNLILNAVQASPPNGEVRIDAGELSPSQLPEGARDFAGGAVAVGVSDHGAGIDPLIRDRLFDPFVSTKPGGSGLGLSIAQRAAAAHGGVVTLSAPGDETRFTLVVPRRRPRPGGDAPGNPTDRPHNR